MWYVVALFMDNERGSMGHFVGPYKTKREAERAAAKITKKFAVGTTVVKPIPFKKWLKIRGREG